MLIKSKDIKKIIEIDSQCFDTPYTKKQLENIEHDTEICYLIIENDIEVGFIILSEIFDNYDLIKICIIKNQRRKGFANKALFELLEIINFETFTLEVSENNIAAINLYKKNNFKEITRRKNYYSDGSNAIIMQLIN